LVRIFDPSTGLLSTLTFTNLTAISDSSAGRVTKIALPGVSVAPGATNLRVNLSTPESFHLNGSAPSKLALASSNPQVLGLGENSVAWSVDEQSVSLPIPVQLEEGSATLTATASVYYCRTGAEALCFIGQFEITLPVTIIPGSGNGEIVLNYELPAA
jgi:hypothetical protein